MSAPFLVEIAPAIEKQQISTFEKLEPANVWHSTNQLIVSVLRNDEI